VAALAAHAPVVRRVTRQVVDRVEDKLGTEVRVGRVAPDGLFGVTLQAVRVGPVDAPLLTVAKVTAQADHEALFSGSRRPRLLELEGVVVHVRGDGTLEGALRALREALPERPASRGGDGGGGARALPEVIVSDGRLIDHGGAGWVDDGELRFSGGRINGSFRRGVGDGTMVGPCELRGPIERIEITCEAPFRRALPQGLAVSAGAVVLRARPTPMVELAEVKIEAAEAEGKVAALLGGTSVSASVGIEADAEGRRPLEVTVRLPAGGELRGDGVIDTSGVEVTLDVSDLPLRAAHASVRGHASGTIRVRAWREERRVEIDGDWRLRGFTVDHAARADGPIGPMELELEGAVRAQARGGGAVVEVRDAQLRVGAVKLAAKGGLDTTGEEPVAHLRIALPRVEATRLVAAIPAGLMPNLAPFDASGHFGFATEVSIDWAALDDAKLEASVDVANLEVSVNRAVDFQSLRSVFRTRFEVPEGKDEIKVIQRTTGPDTDRWTPLAEMPALLPAAVTAQEDGGFYRHPGVSVFHLRGSLIRNLKSGRFARGGSTLTMQLARNLFLNRRKTLSRKLEEVVLTWLLESEFSKDELIQLYLNVVEFGPGIYGIRDAAEHYFKKPPWALEPVEVAFIVRLLPAPRRYYGQFRRGKLSPYYVKWIDKLLARLVERGHLSQAAYDAAEPEMLWQIEAP